MSNIILPKVQILDTISDEAKMLIEQDGEINRFAVANLGGGDISINANTLGGKTESMLSVANAEKFGGRLPNYYAPATKLTPRNLLDNSDFRNPVNQRGFTKHTGGRIYSLDRWQIESINGESIYDQENGWIALHSGALLCQPLEDKNKFLGKTITIAACDELGVLHVKSGTISELPTGTTVKSYCVKNDGTFNIFAQIAGHLPSLYIYVSNVSTNYKGVKWMALYEGEYTAETLPEYQPKGYGAELAECQRYYEKTDLIYDATNMTVDKTFPYKVNKRIPNPTAIIYSDNGRAGYMSRYNADTGIYEDVEVLFVESNAYGARVFSTNNGQFRFRMEISADL